MSAGLQLAKLCEVLAADIVPAATIPSKKALPANNGVLALSYAVALDRLMEQPLTSDSPAKPHYTLYHRLLVHSSRHLLHKYKRGGESQRFQYKCWGIHNFEANEGKWYTYLEYPLTEDLFALKREVTVRTKIQRLNDEKLDDALDNVTDGALKYSSMLSFSDYLDDFGKSVTLLEHFVQFVQAQGKN